jgi:hypothetical protein
MQDKKASEGQSDLRLRPTVSSRLRLIFLGVVMVTCGVAAVIWMVLLCYQKGLSYFRVIVLALLMFFIWAGLYLLIARGRKALLTADAEGVTYTDNSSDRSFIQHEVRLSWVEISSIQTAGRDDRLSDKSNSVIFVYLYDHPDEPMAISLKNADLSSMSQTDLVKQLNQLRQFYLSE